MSHVLSRDLQDLADREYDLIVVGGGILGSCAAWDAAQRGLRVALVERGDFASAASANCFKMIHGGIRYLQHGDLVRLRQSTRERSTLLRIAPHLTRPLPIFMPTYGHGLLGKEVLAAGLIVYDLLTIDRNRGVADPALRIPESHFVSRQDALRLFPGLASERLSGGAVFYDGQMYSPARLALAVLRSACEAGARAANYVAAVEYLRHGSRVIGVRVEDQLEKASFELRGHTVLNATGGWTAPLVASALGCPLQPVPTFSRDAYFVVRRRLPGPYALAVPGRTRDPDALIHRTSRHLFLVPSGDCTLVGVWHLVHRGNPDDARVSDADLKEFLAEINDAYPALELRPEDVVRTHAGLVLFGENPDGATDLRYGKRSRFIDHGRVHGIAGVASSIGVRYTTARHDAALAVDWAFRELRRRSPPCATARTRVHGGDVHSLHELFAEVRQALPPFASDLAEPLARNHGSSYRRVLAYAGEDPNLAERLPGTRSLRAEVVHAVREEMAMRLSDVVFRRTDLGARECPGSAVLAEIAERMGRELGWSAERCKREQLEVEREFHELA